MLIYLKALVPWQDGRFYSASDTGKITLVSLRPRWWRRRSKVLPPKRPLG